MGFNDNKRGGWGINYGYCWNRLKHLVLIHLKKNDRVRTKKYFTWYAFKAYNPTIFVLENSSNTKDQFSNRGCIDVNINFIAIWSVVKDKEGSFSSRDILYKDRIDLGYRDLGIVFLKRAGSAQDWVHYTCWYE